MIDRIVLRRFKRFEEAIFDLRGSHVVLAGPNNMGKTTALQAVAAWDLALRTWKARGDYRKHNGVYALAPIARPDFTAVPVRNFDLLWRDRQNDRLIEVEIRATQGWTITMEMIADTPEQIYARPTRSVPTEALKANHFSAVFVPAMTGLDPGEALFARRETVNLKLSQGRPGDVLRNLLYETSLDEMAWQNLQTAIGRLFNFRLEVPQVGATIVADYKVLPAGPTLDIASAGSGFQQVLMLLAFLHTRPGSVLLLDEPDAHLHVILQDAIYSELRAVAAEQNCQLLIATHSEVVINSVDPSQLCVVLQTPRLLAPNDERARLIRSLRVLTNTDIMIAEEAPGILYLEGPTDLAILRAWARILDHAALELLTMRLFWRQTVHEPRRGADGIKTRDHYEALQIVRADLPGLELLDGDARPDIPDTPITGRGLQRIRWRRYEIESYLVHPAALDRFVEKQVGPGEASREAREALKAEFVRILQEDFLRDPMHPVPLVENYLRTAKARTDLLPPLLGAAGLPNFPHSRYHEIAALMTPDEIPQEVVEKLDSILRAFNQ